MSMFGPYKKRANAFNYIPRYYDPEKEAREMRRAEMRGERLDDESEYAPGKYIRTQREARAARREQENKGQMHVWKLIGGAVFILLVIYILYPKLAEIFVKAVNNPASGQEIVEGNAVRRNGMDQSGVTDVEWSEQAITIVPNDYQE